MVTRLSIALLLIAVHGCSALRKSSHPYATSISGPLRDTYGAQRLNGQGLKALEEDETEDAERCFRKAFEKDLFCASAHNNLGLLLLRSNKPYEAAWEFQFAAKLLPHSVEPRNNLGLVMEKVGQLDQAITHYENALHIDPNNVEVMGHLARAYVKSRRTSDDLKGFLKKISFQNPGGSWDKWARTQLLARELGK